MKPGTITFILGAVLSLSVVFGFALLIPPNTDFILANLIGILALVIVFSFIYISHTSEGGNPHV